MKKVRNVFRNLSFRVLLFCAGRCFGLFLRNRDRMDRFLTFKQGVIEDIWCFLRKKCENRMEKLADLMLREGGKKSAILALSGLRIRQHSAYEHLLLEYEKIYGCIDLPPSFAYDLRRFKEI